MKKQTQASLQIPFETPYLRYISITFDIVSLDIILGFQPKLTRNIIFTVFRHSDLQEIISFIEDRNPDRFSDLQSEIYSKLQQHFNEKPSKILAKKVKNCINKRRIKIFELLFQNPYVDALISLSEERIIELYDDTDPQNVEQLMEFQQIIRKNHPEFLVNTESFEIELLADPSLQHFKKKTISEQLKMLILQMQDSLITSNFIKI